MAGPLARRIFAQLRAYNHTKPTNGRSLWPTQNTTYSTATYEGDGKTKINILNRELDLGLMINSYSQYGFRLNNNLKVVGPMAIFPRLVLIDPPAAQRLM